MTRSTASTYAAFTWARAPKSAKTATIRPREGKSSSTTPATNAIISWTATAGYRSRRNVRTMTSTTPMPTMRASSVTASPPAEHRFHVPEQLRDELDEPQQHDDDAGKAQHVRLFLPAGLGEKDVQDGDDDADARDLVNHRDVHRGRSSPSVQQQHQQGPATGAKAAPQSALHGHFRRGLLLLPRQALQRQPQVSLLVVGERLAEIRRQLQQRGLVGLRERPAPSQGDDAAPPRLRRRNGHRA